MTPTTVMIPTPFASISDQQLYSLGDLEDGGELHLRATVAFPDPAPAELQGTEAEFSIGFLAAGDTETVDSGGPGPGPGGLVNTGAAILVPLLLAAALAVAGAVLRVAARRRESA